MCRKGARTREVVEIKYAEILSSPTALFTFKDEMQFAISLIFGESKYIEEGIQFLR